MSNYRVTYWDEGCKFVMRIGASNYDALRAMLKKRYNRFTIEEVQMELSMEDLKVIHTALDLIGGDVELLTAIEAEIEMRELADVDFDEDDGCAGGACKL